MGDRRYPQQHHQHHRNDSQTSNSYRENHQPNNFNRRGSYENSKPQGNPSYQNNNKHSNYIPRSESNHFNNNNTNNRYNNNNNGPSNRKPYENHREGGQPQQERFRSNPDEQSSILIEGIADINTFNDFEAFVKSLGQTTKFYINKRSHTCVVTYQQQEEAASAMSKLSTMIWPANTPNGEALKVKMMQNGEVTKVITEIQMSQNIHRTQQSTQQGEGQTTADGRPPRREGYQQSSQTSTPWGNNRGSRGTEGIQQTQDQQYQPQYGQSSYRRQDNNPDRSRDRNYKESTREAPSSAHNNSSYHRDHRSSHNASQNNSSWKQYQNTSNDTAIPSYGSNPISNSTTTAVTTSSAPSAPVPAIANNMYSSFNNQYVQQYSSSPQAYGHQTYSNASNIPAISRETTSLQQPAKFSMQSQGQYEDDRRSGVQQQQQQQYQYQSRDVRKQ